MSQNEGPADTSTVRLINLEKKPVIICYMKEEEVLQLLDKGWTVHPDQYNGDYWAYLWLKRGER